MRSDVTDSDDYDEIDRLIDNDPIALGERCRRSEAACRKALEAIAPCVVGWENGTMPVWAENLNRAVPDLQAVLGIEPRTGASA